MQPDLDQTPHSWPLTVPANTRIKAAASFSHIFPDPNLPARPGPPPIIIGEMSTTAAASVMVNSPGQEDPGNHQAIAESKGRRVDQSISSGVDVHGADETSEPRRSTDLTDLNYQTKQTKPWIGHRIEYRNRGTDELISEKVQDPGNQPVVNQIDGPIFETITTYKVVPQGGATPSPMFASQSLPHYGLRIHSIALINAIQSVVRYYPSQDLSGEFITVPRPYPVLVHHYDELQQFRQDCLSRPAADLCVRERQAAEHLRVLLEFLDKEVMEDVRKEQERNKRGLHTFEWRWVALRPGATFIQRIYDEWHAAVIHSLTGGTLENPPQTWDLTRWALDYDGSYIERVWLDEGMCSKFDGEKPDVMVNQEDRVVEITKDGVLQEDETITELVKNGRRFSKMIWEPHSFRHQGKAVRIPHNEINSLVMVDFASHQSIYPDSVRHRISQDDVRNWKTMCTCDVCLRRKEEGSHQKDVTPAFMDFLDIDKDDVLSDHHCLLFPSSVDAYVFRTRSWEKVHIRNLSEPEFDENIINHLVMNEQRLLTLKALSKSFARVSKHGEPLKGPRWSADFVRGKGNGLIFLLHGKPGVGKTCTAECIAEFTRRPLMVLTSSDIGTDPEEVEKNLTSNFKRAMSWGAVMLIDEADVFMERRTTSDLTRNSLVAGFLRALEFYDGILFLTTNRVGSFDDAFISRIHIQLYYPDFTDDERQKVWKTFIDKLARERGDTIRLTMEAKDYIKWTRKQGIKWNGREIRNAFQTAVALAEYDAEKDEEGRILVKDDHLRAVVELSQDFKGYLDGLHNRDEAKRAEQRYERLDSYGQEK